MTQIFNRQSEKETRQSLRNSLPTAELILWSKLKNRQICVWRFRRQFSVGCYVLDFYCPALKLAIEVDGDSHFQPREREKDEMRQQFIESVGIQFLRFRNNEIRQNLRGVLEAIYRKINEIEKSQKRLTPCRKKARRPLAKGDKLLPSGQPPGVDK